MSSEIPDAPRLSALASLRRFAQPRPRREHCDLCDAELAVTHAHLLELATPRLVCACDACAILFDNSASTKYRRVPTRVQLLVDFHLPEETWSALHLPIDLAFFLYSTKAERVLALYPSPAGATESLVPLEAWQSLVEDNPILSELQPDVEALLVNRIGEARDYYGVGIDKCYELVGLLRTHWRGLSGGPAVWDAISRFFADLRGGARHA
jgi:uncharacterized protein DUF5947